jgi:hypothetical protein
MLELYDQTVSNRSGGAMIEYLKQDPLLNKGFLLERCGGEIRRILEAIRNSTRPKQTRLPFIEVITRRLFAIPQKVLTRFRQKLLGSQGSEALQIGQFRLAGEVHQWMYDRYSLTRLLEQAGFQNPQRRGPTESVIPGWASFHLDTDPDGSTYKPDSIYMEAVKPQ